MIPKLNRVFTFLFSLNVANSPLLNRFSIRLQAQPCHSPRDKSLCGVGPILRTDAFPPGGNFWEMQFMSLNCRKATSVLDMRLKKNCFFFDHSQFESPEL